MTTKEFTVELNKLGYKIFDNGQIFITKDGENALIQINKKIIGIIDTDYIEFKDMDLERKTELINLTIKYSLTPIEEREKQEKFYWKLKGFKGNEMNNNRIYFSYSPRYETQMIRRKGDRGSYISAFTVSEFKTLCEERGMVYEAFEKEATE
ncbi:hypothetical protein ERUR111494_02485 [Erysipelothrix urinaevulpis]|uniref:hypothetical protein n=1 Tax=Erysipelothrix urinaevulpis TaxID=2683717 RepID=UPI00135CEC3C|nr:hypothetical protein [Erysipelothrix urinaevulpis]